MLWLDWADVWGSRAAGARGTWELPDSLGSVGHLDLGPAAHTQQQSNRSERAS